METLTYLGGGREVKRLRFCATLPPQSAAHFGNSYLIITLNKADSLRFQRKLVRLVLRWETVVFGASRGLGGSLG